MLLTLNELTIEFANALTGCITSENHYIINLNRERVIKKCEAR